MATGRRPQQTNEGYPMEFFLDPDDGRGLGIQLYGQVREAIAAGRLLPGDRLPSTRAVAIELGVARSTVADAYYRLVAEGYVEGRAGAGTVVSAMPAEPAPRREGVGRAGPLPLPAAVAVRPYGVAGEARFDFRPGSIDPALFPTAAWRRGMLGALDHPASGYGDPAGSPALREALANWVARSRGVRANAGEVMVTSGAGHAIDLIARVLVPPGSVVAVEDPGYPPVSELLRSHGLDVVGVPVDGEGVVVEAIPSSARLMYVTPSHQYPLGMPMSRRRRLELLAWAARTGCPVVEDDYDSEFRYAQRPLEPLQRLDREGWVIYVGTFSKSLSPAIRMGFLVAPRSLLPALGAVRQVIDWCPPDAGQAALHALIVGGHLDRHLRRCRAVYTERRRQLSAGLAAMLPPGFRVLPSVAGLHLTVVAPPRTSPVPASELVPAAELDGVMVSRLERTFIDRPAAAGYLLGFAGIPTDHVPAAVQAFGRVLAREMP